MIKNKLPLISVVIPTYNSMRTIEKCLQSIKKQTYPNIEIIVVDSLFYDKTHQQESRKIIKKYAMYFRDGPERSIQRNRGIQEARGEYILMIDQDMYLSKDVALECYYKIQKNFVALLIPEISIGEGFWTKTVALERYVTTYLENAPNECCRFYRKIDALAIGGYDPAIVGLEDSDFHYRMKDKGRIGKIKKVIYHDEGKTKFFHRIKKKYYYSRAFRAYLKRNPTRAVGQFNPIKPAYFKHWRLLMRDPLVSLGMVVLRGGEIIAGGLGLLLHK